MAQPDKPKDTEPKGQPHDAPGLSPMERMTELTRRIVNVPAKELTRAKQRDEKRRGH